DGCVCWFDMRCKDVARLVMDVSVEPVTSLCFKTVSISQGILVINSFFQAEKQILGEALSNMAVKDLKNLETKLERGISKIRSKKNKLLFAEIRLHAEEDYMAFKCWKVDLHNNNQREVIDEEGWLHTGDIGMWLPGGRLKILIALFHQAFVMHHPPSLPSSSNSVKNTLSELMKYTAKTRENSPRSSGTSPLRTLRFQSLGKLNPIDLKRLSFHMSPPHRATQNKKINEEPDREMEVDHKDVKAEKDDTSEL
ncbi:hypothetical protein S245_024812, partial [Arachis hypogaea]